MSTPTKPLVSGQLLADDRYRLLASHSTRQRAGWEFWQARDQRLGRDVAISVLRGEPTDPSSANAARHVRERLSRAATIKLGTVAQQFDALGPDSPVELGDHVLAIVIAAWTPGRSLLDMVSDGQVGPVPACHMLLPLAEDVSRAHHAGVALGIDDPNRIRCSEARTLTLAFLGPPLNATTSGDVEDVASLLYLLLTGSWPTRHDAAADPLPPLDQRCPAVPRELALVTMLCLRRDPLGGLRTIGPLLHALDAALHNAPPSTTQPVSPSKPPPVSQRHRRVPPVRALRPVVTVGRRALRRPRQAVLATLLAAAALIAFLATATSTGLFPTRQPASPTRPLPLSTSQPAPLHPVTPPTPGSGTGLFRPAPKPVPVTPAGITEYLVGGAPDNPDQLDHVIDNNAATAWSTDQYWQQLPALEPGIGIMVEFGQPVTVVEVDIDSVNAGTVVQIRAAATTNTTLANTDLLATTTLTAGTTVISLPPARSTPNLLVWITRLAGGNGAYQSTINEIYCMATPPTT